MKKDDYITDEKTSSRMRSIRSKNTLLEMQFIRILRELKIKVEKHPSLLGHPDFRIKGSNVLLFCDSSFWHGRREREVSGEAFNRNKKLWVEKLIKNRSRDLKINRNLRSHGWSVWRFLDTDIFKNPDKVKKRLIRIVNAKSKEKTDGN